MQLDQTEQAKHNSGALERCLSENVLRDFSTAKCATARFLDGRGCQKHNYTQGFLASVNKSLLPFFRFDLLPFLEFERDFLVLLLL